MKDISNKLNSNVGTFERYSNILKNSGFKLHNQQVLSSNIIYSFLRSCNLENVWKEELSRLSPSKTTQVALKKVSDKILNHIHLFKFDDKLIEELHSIFDIYCKDGYIYLDASFLADDLNPDISLNFLSIRNIFGKVNLENAIKDIISSIYTAENIYIFHKYSINPFVLNIPIVIRKSAFPTLSGIYMNFTDYNSLFSKIIAYGEEDIEFEVRYYKSDKKIYHYDEINIEHKYKSFTDKLFLQALKLESMLGPELYYFEWCMIKNEIYIENFKVLNKNLNYNNFWTTKNTYINSEKVAVDKLLSIEYIDLSKISDSI